MSNILLSKTNFLYFLECPKKASLTVFHKELNNDDFSPYILGRKESLMTHADEYMSQYGEIYEVRFNKTNSYSEMIKETKDLLEKESCGVIKNYTAIKDDCIVIIDYVGKTEEGLILYEVLNSKSIKPEDLKDVGFQQVVSSINNTKVLFFSEQYNKNINEELDVFELFDEKKIDLKNELKDELKDITLDIGEAQKSISEDLIDKDYINPKCFKCSFATHCLKNEKIDEDYTVYSVPHDKTFKWECLGQGIRKIDDLVFNDVKWVDDAFLGNRNPLLFDNQEPLEDMSPSETALELGKMPKSSGEHHKRLYLESVRFDRPILHKPSINQLMDKLVFPINFFDYEAYQQHIPKAYGEAYEQQIFQWGNHKLQEDGTLTHKQWIVDIDDGHKKDNRMELVDSLIEEFGDNKGSIVAHYVPYEKGRNKDLIAFLQEAYYKEYSPKFEDIKKNALVGIPLTGLKSSVKKIPFVTNDKLIKKYIEETAIDEMEVAKAFFGIGSRSFDIRSPLVLNEIYAIMEAIEFFQNLFKKDKKITTIRDINNRMFEEMDYFKYYYEKDFRGSISIKVIQKVLFKDEKYKHLHYSEQDIKNGGELMHLFDNWDSLTENERELMFKNVLSYNKVDTLLMVEIHNFFKRLVND